jgi:hypothetical protein
LDEGNDKPPDMGFDGRGTAQKKFHLRPVAPTVVRNKPFGKHVKGLSYCAD